MVEYQVWEQPQGSCPKEGCPLSDKELEKIVEDTLKELEMEKDVKICSEIEGSFICPK